MANSVCIRDVCQSYGYFLARGHTSWPERWDLPHGVSRIHGCYNAIGLWFLQGIVGLNFNAADSLYPLHLRPGVETGDVNWARGARATPHGRLVASWSITDHLEYNVSIPANAVARVMVPASDTQQVRESGTVLSAVHGVRVLGRQRLHDIEYIEVEVLSGEYTFTSTWSRQQVAKHVVHSAL